MISYVVLKTKLGTDFVRYKLVGPPPQDTFTRWFSITLSDEELGRVAKGLNPEKYDPKRGLTRFDGSKIRTSGLDPYIVAFYEAATNG